MIVAFDRSQVPVVDGIEFRRVVQGDGYAVGSDGSIWTCRPKRPTYPPATWRQMSPAPNTWGYLVTAIVVQVGKAKTFAIHRMVADAFHGPCPAGLEVRHLDGNKLNNAAGNLCYGTKSQNTYDAIAHGKHPCLTAKGIGNPKAKLTDEMAEEIRAMHRAGMNCGQIFRTGKFPVGKSALQRVVNGKFWNHDAAKLSQKIRGTECVGR